MKKAVSLVLALVLTMSLCVSAFALTLAPVAGKDSVGAGEDVTITLTLDEAIEEITAAEARLYYNDTLFTYKDCAGAQTGITAVAGSGENKYITLNYIDMSGHGSIAAGTFATLTFTAKSDITADASAEFSSQIVSALLVDETKSATTELSKMSVTVTPPAPGYQVGIPADSSAGVNSQIIVPVSVQMTEASGAVQAGKTFNAFTFDVSYDSTLLKFAGVASAAGCELEATETAGGKLRVTGVSHAPISCAEDAIQLKFETYAVSGSAEVTISNAKVDEKANAIDKDAPLAKTSGLTTKVAIGGFGVTLPDGFTGAAVANPGESYTFKAPENGNKYTVTAKVNGKTVPVTDNGDGTYTIDAAYVNGNIDITAVAKKLVTVNVVDNTTGRGKPEISLTDGQTVFEGEALEFTVATPFQILCSYVVKVNDSEIAAQNALQFGPQITYTYKIPASMVTGESITITVEDGVADAWPIIKSGNGWDDVTLEASNADGAVEITGDAIPKTATTLKLTIPNNDKRVYTVKYGFGTTASTEAAAVDGSGNKAYTIDLSSASKALFISLDVSYTEKSEYEAVVSPYVNLGTVDGKPQTMFLITCANKTNHVLTCNDMPMFWSDTYDAWAYLVISEKNAEDVKAEAVIKEAEGSKSTVDYSGDVNITGLVDVNDAQLVCNMYNTDYTDFTKVSVEKFLRADVNGDKTLDTADVAQIIGIIHK